MDNYRIKIRKGQIEFEVEGDKEFVKELFEEFKTDMENISEFKTDMENISESKTDMENISESKTDMENISESKIISSQPNTTQNGKIQPFHNKYTLLELYKIVNPKTNLDRIIIFAYWILKTKNIEFSINDILNYFEQFKIKKPAYISRDFRTLVNPSKGYLIVGKKEGFFSLSFYGIQHFEKELKEVEKK